MELSKIIISPDIVSEPKEKFLLYNSIIAAPATPNPIPKIFPVDIFSFNATAAIIKTIIGFEIIIIDAFIGEVKLNPFRKSN